MAALDASEPAWSNSSRALVARGITALTALGLVYSDQGSAVNEQTWLRGTVARVVNNLALCAGGLKTIAEAVEFMEGRQDLPPLLYDADGQPAVVDGEGVRLAPSRARTSSFAPWRFATQSQTTTMPIPRMPRPTTGSSACRTERPRPSRSWTLSSSVSTRCATMPIRS